MTARNQKSAGRFEERRAEMLQSLADGIDQLSTTQAWQEYLDFQAQFPAYSFGNTMLIMRQCPHASAVLGFGNKEGTSGWKAIGRQVRKGESAIWIWKPSFKKTGPGEDDEEDERSVLRRFISVPVFDISQTDGKPVPEAVRLLQGEDSGNALGYCVAYIQGLGYTAEFVDEIPGGANGDVTWSLKRVRIATNGRSPLQQAKTALHEAGHILCEHQGETDRGRAELEAESVAYVAAKSLGLETSEYSFGYVLAWMGSDPARARKTIKTSGSRIQGAARKILEGIDAVTASAARKAA